MTLIKISQGENVDNSDIIEFANQNKKYNKRLQDAVPASSGSFPAEGMRVNAANAKLWAVSGRCYIPCEQTSSHLPSGHYIVKTNPSLGLYFEQHDFSIDDLMDFPDSNSNEVVQQIEQFWNLESHFRNYGFLWKRGILLWGPPGSGKTSTVQIVAKKIIEKSGIVVSIYDPTLSSVGLQILRRIEPNRPVLGLLEDIDSIIQSYGESDLLSLFDGENQIDNVVYLATTNYPERLDPRFVNRPSRFDIITKIGMPNEDCRRLYLKKKSKKLTNIDLDQWVIDTNGFSMAHLKELIISVEVFMVPYVSAIRRIRAMIGDISDNNHDFKNKKISGFCKNDQN